MSALARFVRAHQVGLLITLWLVLFTAAVTLAGIALTNLPINAPTGGLDF